MESKLKDVDALIKDQPGRPAPELDGQIDVNWAFWEWDKLGTNLLRGFCQATNHTTFIPSDHDATAISLRMPQAQQRSEVGWLAMESCKVQNGELRRLLDILSTVNIIEH